MDFDYNSNGHFINSPSNFDPGGSYNNNDDIGFDLGLSFNDNSQILLDSGPEEYKPEVSGETYSSDDSSGRNDVTSIGVNTVGNNAVNSVTSIGVNTIGNYVPFFLVPCQFFSKRNSFKEFVKLARSINEVSFNKYNSRTNTVSFSVTMVQNTIYIPFQYFSDIAVLEPFTKWFANWLNTHLRLNTNVEALENSVDLSEKGLKFKNDFYHTFTNRNVFKKEYVICIHNNYLTQQEFIDINNNDKKITFPKMTRDEERNKYLYFNNYAEYAQQIIDYLTAHKDAILQEVFGVEAKDLNL